MLRFLRPGTGHDSIAWPVFLLLLIVLVPSAGVLWMMRAAMDNERLAVRQRLLDVYRTQLDFAKHRIDSHWQALGARLNAAARAAPPAQAFAKLVASGEVDGVILLDESGEIAYPNTRAVGVETELLGDGAWREAEQLEFAENDPRAAAKAYHEIAAAKSQPALTAQAQQAEARCLLRAGDKDAAIAVWRRLR